MGRSMTTTLINQNLRVLGNYHELGDYHEWVLVAYLGRYLKANNVQSTHVQNEMMNLDCFQYNFVDVDSGKEYQDTYANVYKLKSDFSK